jgi:hypothetical protein
VVGVVSPPVQLLHDRFRDAPDVSIRGAGGYYEIIGRIIQATKIEHYQLIAFQVLYGIESEAKRFRWLRDRPPVWCILNHSLPRPP